MQACHRELFGLEHVFQERLGRIARRLGVPRKDAPEPDNGFKVVWPGHDALVGMRKQDAIFGQPAFFEARGDVGRDNTFARAGGDGGFDEDECAGRDVLGRWF